LKVREFRVDYQILQYSKRIRKKKELNAKVVKISGAAEVMPSLGAADAIIDVMNTGIH